MANEIQLRITTDLDSLPAAIEFNYDELRAALQTYLSRFDNLVVTEDEIKRAAVDRASINRVAKTIARARIDTKKRYLEPFELFEAKAKELEGLCRNVEAKIAEQLDAFERRRTEEKRSRLERVWSEKLREAFGDLESAQFALFFSENTNPKRTGNWLNKGVSEEAAARAMDAEIQRCREVLEAVEGLYADADEEIKAKAKMEAERSFDFQRAVQAVNAFRTERERLAEARRAAEERRAREEAEAGARAEAAAAAARAAAEARKRAGAEEPRREEAAPAPAEEEQPEPASEPDAAPARRTVTLRFTGTEEQLFRLGQAIDSIDGLQFERI